MKVKSIPSQWIYEEGLRLDCGPYMLGGIEARKILEALDLQKQKLSELTSGHDGGIYNGPKFRRNYVQSPDHGVPFLTSGNFLRSDLSKLPLLSRKDATSQKLSYLEIKEGMTLISCSGTIGRMSYTRPDMVGMWSSQDVLKVVSNTEKVLSGYIYAYLASKFGVPLVVSGTYGAIIQHLEPHQIINLPVPRINKIAEIEIHQLVHESAQLLSAYQKEVVEATNLLFEFVGLENISSYQWHQEGSDIGYKQIFPVPESFRAANFNPRFRKLCENIKNGSWLYLKDICLDESLKRGGGRIKRIDADPEFAYQFIGQKQLFWLRPEGRWLAKAGLSDDVLVLPGTILIPAQGTLGESELYCRSEFIWGVAVERAYSEHLLRVTADESKMLRGCLFAFMRSETAFRMLRSLAVGTKLQDHHYAFLPKLPIPVPSRKDQEIIHQKIIQAYENRDKAVALEDQAIALVEKAIEEAA